MRCRKWWAWQWPKSSATRGERADRGAQLRGDLIGDCNERWFAGHLDQDGRVHRLNNHHAWVIQVGAHQNVAGEQQPDLSIYADSPVCQCRVTCTEDQVVLDVHAELGL